MDVLAACGALVPLMGVTFLGITMRYCLGDPPVWQEEVQPVLTIRVVFLGGRYTSVCGNHVAIDVIIEVFPEKLQKILSVLIAVAAIIVLYRVGYQEARYIMQMVRCDRVTSILKIPYSLICAPLPMGCLIMVT